MPGLPTGVSGDDESFDGYDEFVPEHLPEPGSFLEGHDLLTGEDHVAFHERTRDLFEERGVYDVTFGYNLARLNLDRRHPDAGYRYAQQRGEPAVLRAEFTPTTEFCPQSDTLVRGSFRAWNGLSERHDYDLVRVRVRADGHHASDETNAEVRDLETAYRETGSLADPGGESDAGSAPARDAASAERGPRSPF